jgi:hypothetical protein
MRSKEELTALHEASHAIIAKLFPDILRLKVISLDPKNDFKDISRAKKWNGVNKIGFKKHRKPTEFSVNALVITYWAGFLGQNIGEFGIDFIEKNRGRFLMDPDSFNKTGIQDDLATIRQYTPWITSTRRISEKDHRLFCNEVLLDYFISNGAWVYVERFSQKLLAKKNMKVRRLEILLIFKSIGYLSYLRKERVKFLSEYFNLTKRQKRYYSFRRYF